jgi:hypothetical protein
MAPFYSGGISSPLTEYIIQTKNIEMQRPPKHYIITSFEGQNVLPDTKHHYISIWPITCP